jgi:hypothetical protein
MQAFLVLQPEQLIPPAGAQQSQQFQNPFGGLHAQQFSSQQLAVEDVPHWKVSWTRRFTSLPAHWPVDEQ